MKSNLLFSENPRQFRLRLSARRGGLSARHPTMSHSPSRRFIFAALVALGVVGFCLRAFAATAGSDDADQAAYKNNGVPSWAGGQNGGAGFNAWNLVSADSSGACGFFIGDSKNLAGGSGPDINTNGNSFGLFGKGTGHEAAAYRSFASPLAVGQTFSVQIALNFRNGQKGFDLRNSADDKPLFNLNIGAEDYVVNNAATGNGSVGNTYDSNTFFNLSFTQTDPAGGTWTLTRGGGIPKTVTGTYSGTPGSIKFYVTDTDNGSENDLMFNHLALTGALAAASPSAPPASPGPK